MDGKKRTRGVEFLELRTGTPGSMEAETVILCAGTFESCKLLLASASEDMSHSDADGVVDPN